MKKNKYERQNKRIVDRNSGPTITIKHKISENAKVMFENFAFRVEHGFNIGSCIWDDSSCNI